MNDSSSGVASSAAKIRSPSFSRSASSTTTTALPALMSATARSMDPKSFTVIRPRHQLLHVLRDEIHLDIHGIAGFAHTESGVYTDRRDQRYDERVVRHARHGERYPVHGDRALLD